MTTATHIFQVGQFECLIVKAGGGPRDAVQLFPDVAAETVEQTAAANGYDAHAVEFSLNVLVVKTGTQTVLVDTGLPAGDISVPQTLRDNGIAPESVGLIIITHGHFDHVGGILDANGDFTYPNARYAISRVEWDFQTDEQRLSGQNPAIPTWRKLMENPDRISMIEFGEAETEIIPGLCAVSTPGHTIGHIGVKVESNGKRLLHLVDAAHHPIQVMHPDWSPTFDYDKQQSATTRRVMFEQAAQEQTPLLTYHFAFPGLGHVVEDGEGLRWQVGIE
ncbi:MAG: MBL fold metallo-hydrolase [bacterium]|nr:MBL fold metallo-hydrolase [bacterium]